MSYIQSKIAAFKSLGITASFFNFFQGRATTFAIVFTIVGIILAFKGKLDVNYSLFVTAVQGLVFAHSVKEDWNQQKQSAQATVNVINEVSGPDAKAATPPQPIADSSPSNPSLPSAS